MSVVSLPHFPTARRGWTGRVPNRRVAIDAIAAAMCSTDGTIDALAA